MNRILIVEDEITISRLIAVSLRRAGYDCTVANDGSTAADLIAEHDFDLALLDIMLPGLDGYELLDYLRPLGVPVIFITAKGATKDRVRGLQLGADDYIVKPFEIEELLARVEAVLRRSNTSRCWNLSVLAFTAIWCSFLPFLVTANILHIRRKVY